ncbi:hypothetical protein SAMN05421505_12067 [Sinosporangium album]|uniref:DUF2283 domain-containing protein n=1 Tax=Sinosporangium album TaxID=504805 RepID=A0A1G8EEP6_9ACTN|nr:hypothetical protein [Sinosporangium album]SDH68354.1 hypothetical protein SAMN05421505_12067 [Sinosporangium album]
MSKSLARWEIPVYASWETDPDTDVGYLAFTSERTPGGIAHQSHIEDDDEVLHAAVDWSAGNRLRGVELLGAREMLPAPLRLSAPPPSAGQPHVEWRGVGYVRLEEAGGAWIAFTPEQRREESASRSLARDKNDVLLAVLHWSETGELLGIELVDAESSLPPSLAGCL